MNLLDVLLGVGLTLGLMALKPELFASLIANLIKRKFKSQANHTLNLLGLKFMWVGYYLIKDLPDDPSAEAQLNEIARLLKGLGTKLSFYIALTQSVKDVERAISAAYYNEPHKREEVKQKILVAADKALKRRQAT